MAAVIYAVGEKKTDDGMDYALEEAKTLLWMCDESLGCDDSSLDKP